MRNVTWLVHWYRWSLRLLPLALAIALGYGGMLAHADDQKKSPAPVLKVSRRQPDLGRPEPLREAAASAPVATEASSRRGTEAASVRLSDQRAGSQPTERVAVAPQRSERQRSTSVGTTSAGTGTFQTDRGASSDGWLPRRGSSTGESAAPGTRSPSKPTNTASGRRVARRPLATESMQREANGGLQAPSQITGPSNATGPVGAGQSNADASDPPSLEPAVRGDRETRGWQAVPRMQPPADSPSRVDRGLEVEAEPGDRGLAPRQREADRVMEAQPDAGRSTEPMVEPNDSALGPSDSALGSGRRLETPRSLPVRRPRIEAGAVELEERIEVEERETFRSSERARQLQEELERYEQESVPSDVIAGDVYDEPSLESEGSDGNTERWDNGGEEFEEAEPAPVISAAALRLDEPIRKTLQYYYSRHENVRQRTPWGMLHAIIPYGQDAMVTNGRRRYNAIAWLAGNNPGRNLRILTTTRSGHVVARSGVGLQGHQAQLLAILAQVGVPAEYPLYANGRKYTVADLVQAEMAACKAGEELTFTLIGLSHYVPTDASWRAADGEQWDFERLIREELRQPVVGAACGGTHRLMGFSYALKQRRLEGLPIEGQWVRADTFINDFRDYAWGLQNRDGSFSTDWLEGRADNGKLDRKLQTTGHILEWLIFTASREELQEDRVTRGVQFLTSAMYNNPRQDWQVGPKGHALRALSLYHRRVFGSEQPWSRSSTPTRPTVSQQRHPHR